MKLFTIILLTSITLISCKKTYTCRCFNPGGVLESFPINDTKKKAESKCNDYGKKYQDVPWSESGCSIN
jgi:hypothetical protein